MRSQFNLQCRLFPLYPFIKDSGDNADESRSKLSEPGVVFKRPISADSVRLYSRAGQEKPGQAVSCQDLEHA